jgi:hypothetical protein
MVDETVRLLAAAGVDLPVTKEWWDPSMTVRPVKATATYDDNPLSALADLWALMGAAVWVNRDGQLEPKPLDPSAVPAVVRASEVYELGWEPAAQPCNRVIVTGSDEGNAPLRGVAQVTVGPYRVDGPYGVRTRREQMSVAKTQAAVDQAARTYLWSELGGMSRLVTARVHPAVGLRLDVLDEVTLVTPDRRPVTGQVVQLDHTLGDASTVTIRSSEEST